MTEGISTYDNSLSDLLSRYLKLIKQCDIHVQMPAVPVPMRMEIDRWWNSEDCYSRESCLVVQSSCENLPSHGYHR